MYTCRVPAAQPAGHSAAPVLAGSASRYRPHPATRRQLSAIAETDHGSSAWASAWSGVIAFNR
jgi:hypothetical protein